MKCKKLEEFDCSEFGGKCLAYTINEKREEGLDNRYFDELMLSCYNPGLLRGIYLGLKELFRKNKTYAWSLEEMPEL